MRSDRLRQPTVLPKRTVNRIPPTTIAMPNSQLFLNSLTDDAANEFKSAIYASEVYVNLVNPRHIDPSLTVDQLASLKSIRKEDGRPKGRKILIKEIVECLHCLGVYLTNWMACYIRRKHMERPPSDYPSTRLYANGVSWP